MRIRQIKPDFWSDKVLAAFDDATRLFYIGLWMEADDDGYFRNDPDRIAADLFPFKSVAGRERFVRSALLRLADSGHIRLLECERHAVVPNLPKYQVVASTRRTVRTHGEHNAQCLDNAPPSGNGNGNGNGNGTGTGSFRHTDADERTRESVIDEMQRIIDDDTSTPAAKRAAKKALERISIDAGDMK
jgi:hypothetical protein